MNNYTRRQAKKLEREAKKLEEIIQVNDIDKHHVFYSTRVDNTWYLHKN